MFGIATNYQDVCRAVEQAAEAAGRPADAVKLVAVSKTFPADDIREVYAAGQRDFWRELYSGMV